MRKKYGIDKLSISVKVYRKDWEKVAELASLRGCSMPDATHEVVESWLKHGQKHPRNEAMSTTEVVPKPSLNILGIVVTGNKISHATRAIQPEEYIPWYDRTKHKQGERVRMRGNNGRVQIVVVPELDGERNQIW